MCLLPLNVHGTLQPIVHWMQLKVFVTHLQLGLMIVSLTFIGQVFRAAVVVADEEQTDIIELEDEDIKQELGPSETEEIEDEEDDNASKQEDEMEVEEQQSNDDTAGTGLEEDNITIDYDIYRSDNNVPFELPFDNTLPFP